jgi:hypothetical protein
MVRPGSMLTRKTSARSLRTRSGTKPSDCVIASMRRASRSGQITPDPAIV